MTTISLESADWLKLASALLGDAEESLLVDCDGGGVRGASSIEVGKIVDGGGGGGGGKAAKFGGSACGRGKGGGIGIPGGNGGIMPNGGGGKNGGGIPTGGAPGGRTTPGGAGIRPDLNMAVVLSISSCAWSSIHFW